MGHVGAGSAAVTEAANAISRLRKVPVGTELTQRALRDFTTLFNGVD